MASARLLLIQKDDSPFGSAAQLALEEFGAQIIAPKITPSLPEAVSAGGLALWDLSGFTPAEAEVLAGELKAREIGVVVVCGDMDSLCRSVLKGLEPLGVVHRPQAPAAISGALETAGALHRRLQTARAEAARLEQKLQERGLIDRAKRRLMRTRGLSEDEAFRKMQKYSRDHNLKLVEAARRVIENNPASQDEDS
jgi:hypothetical protein